MKTLNHLKFLLPILAFVLMVISLGSCEEEIITEVRLRNSDPVHNYTEVEFGNYFSGSLGSNETTGYFEVLQGTYTLEWTFFAFGTYWATSEDVVQISNPGKYIIRIGMNEATLERE